MLQRLTRLLTSTYLSGNDIVEISSTLQSPAPGKDAAGALVTGFHARTLLCAFLWIQAIKL